MLFLGNVVEECALLLPCSSNPYRHFLVVNAKMMSNFVKYSMPHLPSNTIRIPIAIIYDRALVNGNDFRMWHPGLTIGSQRNTLVESQQRIALFHTYSLHHLLTRLVLHSHQHIFHLLVKLSWNSSQCLPYKSLERTQLVSVGIFTFFQTFFFFSFYKGVLHLVAMIVSLCADYVGKYII